MHQPAPLCRSHIRSSGMYHLVSGVWDQLPGNLILRFSFPRFHLFCHMAVLIFIVTTLICFPFFSVSLKAKSHLFHISFLPETFSPSTGLMSQIRAIFRIICSSVFIATYAWQAIVFFLISVFISFFRTPPQWSTTWILPQISNWARLYGHSTAGIDNYCLWLLVTFLLNVVLIYPIQFC